ncbi:MAG: hypothetical protein V7L25_15760 [Nostoc sp.]
MNCIRQATDNYIVLDSAIVYSRRFEVLSCFLGSISLLQKYQVVS